RSAIRHECREAFRVRRFELGVSPTWSGLARAGVWIVSRIGAAEVRQSGGARFQSFRAEKSGGVLVLRLATELEPLVSAAACDHRRLLGCRKQTALAGFEIAVAFA